MEIRELVKHTGVPAKTIRYYEEIKILPPQPESPMSTESIQIKT